jgi:hypothetical protein
MWQFHSDTGQLFDPSNIYQTTGYAGGNEGRNPEGRNNPAMEAVPNVGPLPRGIYAMGEPVEHSHLGPFAIPLTPDPANEMFGRSGFYCHGDTTPPGNASEGCIIMPLAIRNQMWASDDHLIQVQ